MTFTRTAALALFLLSASAHADITGTINTMNYDLELGTTPGTDQVTVTGTYARGPGNNGFNFATDTVVVSADGGRFTQTLPPGSLTAIGGGFQYSSSLPGIKLLRILNNGNFTLQIRNVDLSGASQDRLEALALTIGDDYFEKLPNSIPVARIAGPSTGLVNETQVLSGAASSDYNLDSLSYNFSIVSKPIGSLASLSATGSAAGFTPDLNGYYVIRLEVEDAAGPGVPAVFTVKASGAPDTPPPAPGATNGFITLSSNQPSYIVGEAATLRIDIDVPESSGNNEYFYRATLNDAPIALTTIPQSGGDQQHVTPVFASAGTQTFRVDLYVQNTRIANGLETAIAYYTTQISKVDAALAYETDPTKIAELQAEKASYQASLARAESELEENRTLIGRPAIYSFDVN